MSPSHDFSDADLAASVPRILVVDDEEPVRRSVSRALASSGFEVVSVQSGEEALEAVSAVPRPFDLVISDVVMQGMSGVALAERIRLREDATQVLLISGYPGTHFEDAAFTTGSIELLTKPFTPAQLTARVYECVQRKLPR